MPDLESRLSAELTKGNSAMYGFSELEIVAQSSQHPLVLISNGVQLKFWVYPSGVKSVWHELHAIELLALSEFGLWLDHPCHSSIVLAFFPLTDCSTTNGFDLYWSKQFQNWIQILEKFKWGAASSSFSWTVPSAYKRPAFSSLAVESPGLC